MKYSSLLGALVAAQALAFASAASVQANTSIPLPYERPSLMSPNAAHTVITGIAVAGPRLVAVGARGVVLLSDDNGNSWRQVQSPVSVTLTAVHFINEKQGWAVGHSGVILHSRDGGESWVRQFDGIQAAVAVGGRVDQMVGEIDEEQAAVLQDYAGLLKEDGPDKPFLDVRFLDSQTGFVVGAFGLAFRTDDGGQTWIPWFEHIDNPDQLHLYAIEGDRERLVIVGEQGLYLIGSGDGRFASQQTPYSGSFFAAAQLDDQTWLLAGLRGNTVIHSLRTDEFRLLNSPEPVSFNAALGLGDGSALLANQAGKLFRVTANSESIRPLPLKPMPPLTDLSRVDPETIVLGGFRGPIPLDLPAVLDSRGEQQ